MAENNHVTAEIRQAAGFLSFRGVSRAFHGVQALANLDLEIAQGRIHGLIGENGAGKSTLINLATGVLQPDRGKLLIEGRPVTLHNPLDAARQGIIAVHQEAHLFAELSLAENMLLGEGLRRGKLGLVNWRATNAEAQRRLKEMHVELDAAQPAGLLSIGRRTLAEIAAAAAAHPKVLFLDEPTASLTLTETRLLFTLLEQLKRDGIAIVFVSHHLEEVQAICDVITVLRDGRKVETRAASDLTIDLMIGLMAGRERRAIFSRTHGTPGEVALRVDHLRDPAGKFNDVSFELRRGEILGLYGLLGAGRTELARAIFGMTPAHGKIELEGVVRNFRHPAQAREAGLAYLPEDRLGEGIFARHAVRWNLTAAVLRKMGSWGWVSRAREENATRKMVEALRVRLATAEQPINTLSGGNQQKIVFGRWLETDPLVLILDEPTRGVDVEAKAEIHRLIDDLAARGKAILLISSELPEVMQMSDRLAVMSGGRLSAMLDPRTASEDEIVAAAIPRGKENSVRDAVAVGRAQRLLARFRELGIVSAMLLIVLGMALKHPAEFATFKNLLDVLTAASMTSLAAAGMTLVIVAGGIDISIGSMLGLCGAVAGMAALRGFPVSACLLISLVLGGALGAINSLCSTLGRIHPIIVTLAGISIYRGVMILITGGYEVNLPQATYHAFANGTFLWLPRVVWFAFGVLALNWIFLGYTLMGRRLIALGNSEKRALLIGLTPWRLRLLSFALLGALVGLAAVLWGSYYGQIQSNSGQGWELQVIAAVVIGGCSIAGGRATALGSFLGAVLISLIYNALVILKISAYWQSIFVGGLILAAVLIDAWLPRLLAHGGKR